MSTTPDETTTGRRADPGPTPDRAPAAGPTGGPAGPPWDRPHEGGHHPPLRRSSDDRVIAGVAGGLGRYLDVDPVIIRVALVLFALSGGAGVLAYIIAWIAIPDGQPGDDLAPARRPERNNGAIVVGALLVIGGGLLLADRVVPDLASFLGPIVLIGLGAALVVGARR